MSVPALCVKLPPGPFDSRAVLDVEDAFVREASLQGVAALSVPGLLKPAVAREPEWPLPSSVSVSVSLAPMLLVSVSTPLLFVMLAAPDSGFRAMSALSITTGALPLVVPPLWLKVPLYSSERAVVDDRAAVEVEDEVRRREVSGGCGRRR